MRRALRTAATGARLAALVLAGALAAGPALAQERPAIPRGELRVDSLWSPALRERKRLLVYLPPSYGTEPGRRYPVAYYLHGLYGSEEDWARQGRIAETADSLVAHGMSELIVVLPDGDDGWYTTWQTPADAAACRLVARTEPPERYCVAHARYDTYVARDLVAHVDSTYRTLPVRAHRGIAGLSMGGYGAITLALAHPTVFSAAASHSGILSPLHRPTADSTAPPAAAYAADSAELARIWGRMWPLVRPAFGDDTASWWARDPARLLERARADGQVSLPALYLDVGRDDAFAHQTHDFHRTLHRVSVPHTYLERPGTHDWAYWRRWAVESLRWMAERL